MAALLTAKVVAALPGTLVANTIYFVRVGAGFDLHVTNDQGLVVAYTLNASAGATIREVEVDFTAASRGKLFDIAVPGVTAGQKIVATPSLKMPAGVQQDEFEADPFAVAAHVQATDTVRLAVIALAGPIKGKRNINLMVI
jgi:hypothetical protein